MWAMTRYRPANLFLIALLFILQVLNPAFANDTQNSSPNQSWFSAKVDAALKQTANALDHGLIKLVDKLDKSEVLNIKVHSHFYDARIRRYFISVSGDGQFKGRLPERLKASEYLISCEKEVSYDFYISEIKYQGTGFSFKFSGAIVFSLDQIAYELMKTVPHLAASGALSPAADLLTELLKKLDIGILSEAISDTLKSFSSVAISRAGADLLSAAGNNKKLSVVIKEAMNDNSILSFLGLSIIKSAAKSLVNVAGASFGSAVGSVVAPGIGTMIGGYIGSRIASFVASTVVYQLTIKLPVIRDMNKMLCFHQILTRNPNDQVAAESYNHSLNLILRKIFREFNSDSFKLFHLVINRIDQHAKEERPAFVPLLRSLQEKLLFLVINEGDWLFAKYYHQLRLKVEAWGLQDEVPFTSR
ncbi:MAG: hypothetical protein ACOYXC_08575 [Candidatus Rifleibacteriota bacterium]